MATKIIHKKSSVAASVPVSSDIAPGELALNLADQKIYSKQTDGTIIEMAPNVDQLALSETCKNVSGGSLSIGTPVYQSGTAGNAMEVQAARADTAGSMPAVGILAQTLADDVEGTLVLTGFVQGLDTSSFSEGDTLYIAATGGLTTTPPTGEANLIQNIGKVIKVHASNGSIMVTGAGRANATPNLDNGDTFIGNGSNQAVTASFNDTVDTHLNTSTATTGEVLSWTGTDYDWIAAGGGGPDLFAENWNGTTTQPSATGVNAVAIGTGSNSTGTGALSGPHSNAGGNYSFAAAIGNSTSSYGSQGNNSVAFGANSLSYGLNSAALGAGAQAMGTGSAAVRLSYSSGADSFAAAIANNTSSYGATGANSIAMGRLAKSTNSDSVAIGYNNRAVGARSIAAGYNNLSYTDGFCFGNGNGSQSASIAAGRNNNAWGNGSVAIGDTNEVASNAVGGICIGQSCDVNNDHDRAMAIGSGAQTRAKGHHVYANYSSAYQSGRWILFKSTTDATATALSTDNASASTANQIILPNDSVYGFTGTVIAREDSSSTDDFAVWEIKGGAVRGASASTTALGSYNINKISESTGAANWSIALSADTTNGAVAITVTGEAAHNIRWVATINTTEVIY